MIKAGKLFQWIKRAIPFSIILTLALGLVLGHGITRWIGPEDVARGPVDLESTQEAGTVWTCSMHPQIRAQEPGLCPLCAMDLIPVKDDGGTEGASRRFSMSEDARQLHKIQTSPVERRFVTRDVRLVGKVAYDETRLASISAWAPGRLDRLYVDYTGMAVRKGDHLVSIFSPELLTAQQELRSAAQAAKELRPEAPETLRRTAQATLDAARGKLRRWGLTDAQINQAESGEAVSDHITIYAPIGGTIIEREGLEGAYVDTGATIYRIADLSKLWVMLEAYESDLIWLHYGQPVRFTTDAWPGELFEGRIAFISPLLNDMTRTVQVRVNVPNPEGKLKPEMFVRAVVSSNVATGGRIMDPGLAGKWISPMHPEIVKDGPGSCDVCGMALVRAETLGYVPAEATQEDKPLVIPATAPLITGTRAIVYVEVPDQERPTFEGREIALGPRAGDYYLVAHGLEAGEEVVTHGNFKIDSALQIMARPSMMNPETSDVDPHDGVTAMPEMGGHRHE